jgi:hypothetical protein
MNKKRWWCIGDSKKIFTFAGLLCAGAWWACTFLLTFNERLYRKTYFHYGAEQNCSEREFRLECVRE